MIQAHIFYSGTVQGIGFRYTAQRLANSLSLKGWVKNLADGRVEILAEGPQENIERLCQSLEQHFDGYIRGVEKDLHEPQGKLEKFQITY